MKVLKSHQKPSMDQKVATWHLKPEPVCPECRSELSVIHKATGKIGCETCKKCYSCHAGFLDLRTRSDRYLSLNQERQKAKRLADYEAKESLEGLTRQYYRMTADVSPSRREMFVRHVLKSELRGQALLKLIPESGTVLEVGAGTGGFLAAAAKAGRMITGVDIASRWLVVARKRHSELNLEHQVPLYPACAENLPWKDQTFDHTVADSLLEHLEYPQEAISEMIRVTKPGGTVLLWFPNRNWPGMDPHVSLRGLNFLNRSTAERDIKWRRGNIHWPEMRSPREWSRMISSQNSFIDIQYQAADLTGWPQSDCSMKGICTRLLGNVSKLPVASILMTHFGPIGQIRILKNPMGLKPFHFEPNGIVQ